MKREIEGRLRAVIARTERFGHEAGQDAAELVEVPAPLDPADLRAFRHLVDCFNGKPDGQTNGVGTAVAYWSSVPLAMQTLGPDYKAWEAAERRRTTDRSLRLAKADTTRFRGPVDWPHPRLRALGERFAPERLAVPWMPPSLPWWPLGTRWADAPPEKALLFSRFRTVPRAVAGLMSYDLERHLLHGSDLRFSDVTKKTLLGPQRENLAFFHPCAALARLVEPYQLEGSAPPALHRKAARSLTTALAQRGVEVRRRSGRARPLPELLVLLERHFGTWDVSLAVWREFATALARTEVAGEMSLRARVDQWDAAVDGSLDALDPRELQTLSSAALAGAGCVVARSLERHGLRLDGHAGRLRALRVSWEGLRSYLNNPWMDASLSGAGDYRERIARAILEGNLESVLDEHLWVTGTLRYLDPEALAAHLGTALSLRTSDVKLYGLDGRDFNLRAHAVLAFTQAVRRHTPDTAEDADPSVRTDDLRVAFNSPFWPHVLASTSVGQEGLDFHTWCSAVAHWDLPGSPVDLEQREGRVDRYAGLSTRRVLASRFAPRRSAVESGASPWVELAERADRAYRSAPSGLAPWWIVEGARVRRLVFDVPLSEAKARFEHLRQQRLLYRLTLGQPDQADLVRALHGRLTPEEAVAATIDLSPWRTS